MTEPLPYDPTEKDWGYSFDAAEGPNHAIDETVTGGAFASVERPAWHGLGVTVDHQVSASHLLKLAHADYQIYRSPIMTELEMEINGVKVTRTATDAKRVNICRIHPEKGYLQILGQASPNYPLWTPRDTLVNFGEAILQFGEPTVSTCGVLHEGRQVFMSFKLPKEIKVGGVVDEKVDLYLVVSTSFDTSAPTEAFISPLRAVCANTVRVGRMKSLSRYTVKKTKNAELAGQYAQEALGLVLPFMDEFQRAADAMIETQVSNDLFNKLITEQFGPGEEPSKKAQTQWEAKEEALMALFTQADTQANARNTAWGALQAVTEYCDWYTKTTGDEGQAAAKRFTRSVYLEKSVTNPKDAFATRLAELAGV